MDIEDTKKLLDILDNAKTEAAARNEEDTDEEPDFEPWMMP